MAEATATGTLELERVLWWTLSSLAVRGFQLRALRALGWHFRAVIKASRAGRVHQGDFQCSLVSFLVNEFQALRG